MLLADPDTAADGPLAANQGGICEPKKRLVFWSDHRHFTDLGVSKGRNYLCLRTKLIALARFWP